MNFKVERDKEWWETVEQVWKDLEATEKVGKATKSSVSRLWIKEVRPRQNYLEKIGKKS